MKKLYPIFIFILLFACKEDNQPENNTSSAGAKNASFVEKNTNETILNNDFFQSFQYEEGENVKTKILHIKQKETIFSKSLFSNSEMQISDEKGTWKIETKAHELSVKNNTLVAKTKADYDHEDTYSLYNIETGKHLLDYSYNCMTVRIPQSNFKRYIGFTARSNSNNLLKDYDADVIGIITYASETETLKRFMVKSNAEVNKTTPSMELISFDENHSLYESNQLLYLMNLTQNYKPEDLNFAFAFKFYLGEAAEESAILIEIKNDIVDLKGAKFNDKVFQIKEL